MLENLLVNDGENSLKLVEKFDSYGLFDSIVMLTWSNWFTEMRSNRYHYATRLSKFYPVIFVQPDLHTHSYYFEKTEFESIKVVHVYAASGVVQSNLINQALYELNLKNPILWTYNFKFYTFIKSRSSSLKIYHATEDYFSEFHNVNTDKDLSATLAETDLLISVSAGVEESYVNKGKYQGAKVLAENGCDFEFWSEAKSTDPKPKTIIYQGGISQKLDLQLLSDLIEDLNDWNFIFCGQMAEGFNEFQIKILKYENVKYLGNLSVNEVRNQCASATIAIIPFIQEDVIINRSWPLKALEYLASGLPIISVPIRSLHKFKEAIFFATDAKGFKDYVLKLENFKNNSRFKELAIQYSKSNDYNLRFNLVVSEVEKLLQEKNQNILKNQCVSGRANSGLVIYSLDSIKNNNQEEALHYLAENSKNKHFFYNIEQGKFLIDLSRFDFVTLVFSKLGYDNYLYKDWLVSLLKSFGGIKVLIFDNEGRIKEVINDRAFFSIFNYSVFYSNSNKDTFSDYDNKINRHSYRKKESNFVLSIVGSFSGSDFSILSENKKILISNKVLRQNVILEESDPQTNYYKSRVVLDFKIFLKSFLYAIIFSLFPRSASARDKTVNTLYRSYRYLVYLKNRSLSILTLSINKENKK